MNMQHQQPPQQPLQQAMAFSQASLFDGSVPAPRLPRRSPSADLRKANGQFLALKRAGHLWQENALVHLATFIDGIKSSMRQPLFTFEEFRVYSETENIPGPAHVNAWGALPGLAKKRGMVEWTGNYVTSVRAESHGRPAKQWMAL